MDFKKVKEDKIVVYVKYVNTVNKKKIRSNFTQYFTDYDEGLKYFNKLYNKNFKEQLGKGSRINVKIEPVKVSKMVYDDRGLPLFDDVQLGKYFVPLDGDFVKDSKDPYHLISYNFIFIAEEKEVNPYIMQYDYKKNVLIFYTTDTYDYMKSIESQIKEFKYEIQCDEKDIPWYKLQAKEKILAKMKFELRKEIQSFINHIVQKEIYTY